MQEGHVESFPHQKYYGCKIVFFLLTVADKPLSVTIGSSSSISLNGVAQCVFPTHTKKNQWLVKLGRNIKCSGLQTFNFLEFFPHSSKPESDICQRDALGGKSSRISSYHESRPRNNKGAAAWPRRKTKALGVGPPGFWVGVPALSPWKLGPLSDFTSSLAKMRGWLSRLSVPQNPPQSWGLCLDSSGSGTLGYMGVDTADSYRLLQLLALS